MTETREFSTAAIASLSTGILLCDFSTMHEAAEYLMGHPIWTHHFADKGLWSKMQQAVLAQCPGIPTNIEDTTKDNYLDKLAEIEKVFGKTITLQKGDGGTAMSPFDGIPDRLKDKTIAVVV